MTGPDPRRLADADPFVRTMLDAAQDDRPNELALERTLRAVSSGAVAASVIGVAAQAKATASAGSAALGSASSIGLGLLAKWATAGFVAGLITVGTVAGFKASANRTRAPAAASTRSAATTPPMSVAHPNLSWSPEPPPSETASTNDAHVTPPRTDDGARDSNVQLMEETLVLDRVRSVLRSGNIQAACAALDHYDERFARRLLEPEALLLRMESETARGNTAAARQAGEAIVQRFPRSPQVTRARALLGAFDGESP